MRGAFLEEEQQEVIEKLKEAAERGLFHSSMELLGANENFEYIHREFSAERRKTEDFNELLPQRFWPVVQRLSPHLRYNQLWVQKYPTGGFIRPHMDPRSYVGEVLVAVFGQFEGGELIIDQRPVTPPLRSGDVIVFGANWLGDEPMPLHQISPLTAGQRFSVILNAKYPTHHFPAFSCACSQNPIGFFLFYFFLSFLFFLLRK